LIFKLCMMSLRMVLIAVGIGLTGLSIRNCLTWIEIIEILANMAKVKTTTLKANPTPKDVSPYHGIFPNPNKTTPEAAVVGSEQLQTMNATEAHALIGKAYVWASQLGIPMNEFLETILDMADAIDAFHLVEK